MARPKVHPEGVVAITYMVPESLKDQVSDLAWKRRISASELVRVALSDYVKKQEKKEAAVA